MLDTSTLVFMKENEEDGSEKKSSGKPVYEFFKRTFDFLASLAALIILSPVLLLIALIIFIDDPKGSPIFVQTRIGQHGKPFRLFKFRTMMVNAEEMLDDLMDKNESDEVVFKIKKDPRITRVGSLLRKTSIDELPQLLNVVLGDMSIVGPRPPLEREVVQYSPRARKRLSVKPGITCLWQIQENRNDISFERWVDLDLEYINNRSFLMDLQIIFKTIGAVVNAQGR